MDMQKLSIRPGMTFGTPNGLCAQETNGVVVMATASIECVVATIELGDLSERAEAERVAYQARMEVEQRERDALRAEINAAETVIAKLEVRLGLRVAFDPRSTWRGALRKLRILRIFGLTPKSRSVGRAGLSLQGSLEAAIARRDELEQASVARSGSA